MSDIFTTNNIKLRLTDKNETHLTFLEWRTLINGVGCDSNMELIDQAISDLNTKTDGKADGLILDAPTGVLQLTHNGEPIAGASVVLNLNNYYTKSEIDDIKTDLEDDLSLLDKQVQDNKADHDELQKTVDDIDFSVSSPVSDQKGNRTAKLQLTIGDKTFSYDLEVDKALDENSIGAVMSDVAHLTVDSLSTSRKIPRYLAKDTSDINYTDIHDRRIAMVRAWTDGSTEQATNSNGQKLWWAQDISDCDIGDDGYPYINDVRVPTVTYDNGDKNKVIVYVYSEGDRWLQTTDSKNNYGPRQIWGEGDGSEAGYGKGYIEKLGLSFDLYNQGTDGVKRGVFIGNEYMDLIGRRKAELIKVTKSGMTINLQGDVSYGYTFGYDASGNLTTLTDNEGHVITLEMEADDE